MENNPTPNNSGGGVQQGGVKRSDSRLSFMEGITNAFEGSKSDTGSDMMNNLTSALEKIDFSLNGGSGEDECLGPFLNAVFDKVESMMDNSVYVNLMLTGLVSRLACYPQPLLRSFLLNSNLVIKPGVRSLVQVSQIHRYHILYNIYNIRYLWSDFSIVLEKKVEISQPWLLNW